MANGTIIPSHAVWAGTMEIAGISRQVELEIFNSQGGWDLLFGKPLLHTFNAIHDYRDDTVTISSETSGRSWTLHNGGLETTGTTPQLKQVPTSIPDDDNKHVKSTESEIPNMNVVNKAPNIYTRNSEPFNPERTAEIQRLVQVGTDLTNEQRQQVTAIIGEYADCFALALSEVNAVPGYEHKLNIPENVTLPKKIPLRSYNPAQTTHLHTTLHEMKEAGIIRPIHPSNVRCVAPTVLAQKAHEGGGLTLDELKHKLNDECIAHGFEPMPDMPPRPMTDEHHIETPKPVKWRICQDFHEVNQITQIAPVPQGDIRAKQMRLSGHRYLHVFDFAAGFYHIAVHEDSQPYLCFYVEGHGHWAYQRMPFGVTGAPAEFCSMMAAKTHDLIANGTFELFVDDGGSAADTFEEGIAKLRTILERVRKEHLSLSPSKLRLFMTEAVFAGSVVGPNGVSPDAAKLSTIVNWKIPEDASHLDGFLGLTSYFRDLIQGYARIEGPLRNLLQKVGIPAGAKKNIYQRMMKAYKLKEVWKEEHTRAFLKLKQTLISEPVLVAPRFDGTPFILTTDGCVDAFAGVLCQKIATTLPGGRVVTKRHPIAFASKRTSTTERKYKPFLLEFAALKFSIDKFSDTLYGFPVEIETDCQALRDTLLSEKLSTTHARWRDGILAHQIVDVRHVPGVTNIADGLSRQHEGFPHEANDGSDWTVSPDWEAKEGIVNDVYQVRVSQKRTQYANLRGRLKDEPLYIQVIDALEGLENPESSLRTRIRAQHRASQYMIEEEKLWIIGGGTGVRAKTRRECISKAEAVEKAKGVHETGGHWHRDSIKIAMLDLYHSPKLDESIMKAITSCARCKNFGGSHLNATLQPIVRRHPFELLVGDYLSMPEGKGGYHTVGLYLDTYSQHVWGYMFKTHGSAKTTIRSLNDICHNFVPPESWQSDGGRHFDNDEVDNICEEWGIKHIVTAAYSPWVNGLVEGTNKLLLYVLARLCAPELGEDGWRTTSRENVPRSWPDHFDEAIRILNWRILPALKFTPKELLLGTVVNTTRTPTKLSTSILEPEDIDIHMAYAEQQRLDGHAESVHHALQRKEAFDRKILETQGEPVEFKKGELVQVYRNDLIHTVSNDRKLTPMWSEPRRVKDRKLNSYTIEDLNGEELPGSYHARRLRRFTPRAGTELAVVERMREEPEGERESQGEERREGQEEEGRKEGKETTKTTAEVGQPSKPRRPKKTSTPKTSFQTEEEAEDGSDETESGGGTIAERVLERRRGRRHEGEGNLE
jgi:transposase InsO family protein